MTYIIINVQTCIHEKPLHTTLYSQTCIHNTYYHFACNNLNMHPSLSLNWGYALLHAHASPACLCLHAAPYFSCHHHCFCLHLVPIYTFGIFIPTSFNSVMKNVLVLYYIIKWGIYTVWSMTMGTDHTNHSTVYHTMCFTLKNWPFMVLCKLQSNSI